MVIVLIPPSGFQSLRPHPDRIQTTASAHFPVLVAVIPATPERHRERSIHAARRPDAHDLEAACAVARGCMAATFHAGQSHCSATNVRMRRDGPPRMEGRSTWSGRERSSHSRFPPVPRVRLVTFNFLPAVFPVVSSSFSSQYSPRFQTCTRCTSVVHWSLHRGPHASRQNGARARRWGAAGHPCRACRFICALRRC
jgi:hypothetical protein